MNRVPFLLLALVATARADDADARHKKNLLVLIKQTKSPATLVLALRMLKDAGGDLREAVPVAVEAAERVGVFAEEPLEKLKENGTVASVVDLIESLGKNPNDPEKKEAKERKPAKLAHLASKDAKKVPKVVILTHHSLDIDTGLIGADRDVAAMLSCHLQALAKAYGEKVEFVPYREVEEYKNRHADWKHDLTAVGTHFKATHVGYIEFLEWSMRDPKKVNMYQGKCQTVVQLFDVNKPDDPPLSENLGYKFPDASRDGIPEEDMHADQFRRTFAERIAKKLRFYFADQPLEELDSMDR